VLNEQVAQLANPEPLAFADALRTLFESKETRSQIGARGRALAEQKYTFEVFQQRLNELYDRVGNQVEPYTNLSQPTT
ncbi:MAG: glycosyltransferase, partial [Bdellovibrionales bacterium]|nr:glycosyltransferase [Bdellovibrionales bacterium]